MCWGRKIRNLHPPKYAPHHHHLQFSMARLLARRPCLAGWFGYASLSQSPSTTPYFYFSHFRRIDIILLLYCDSVMFSQCMVAKCYLDSCAVVPWTIQVLVHRNRQISVHKLFILVQLYLFLSLLFFLGMNHIYWFTEWKYSTDRSFHNSDGKMCS